MKIPLIPKNEELDQGEGLWDAARPSIQVSPMKAVIERTMRKDQREDIHQTMWVDNSSGKLCLALEEDQLVLLHSLLKIAMDLSFIVGAESSEEVIELEDIFEEAILLLEEKSELELARLAAQL